MASTGPGDDDDDDDELVVGPKLRAVEVSDVRARESAVIEEHHKMMELALSSIGFRPPPTAGDVSDFGGYRDLRPHMPVFPLRSSRRRKGVDVSEQAPDTTADDQAGSGALSLTGRRSLGRQGSWGSS